MKHCLCTSAKFPPTPGGVRAARTTVRARRGAIFLITLGTIVILSAMLLVFARNMRTAALASANSLAAVQADAIELGAERWVLAVVEGTPGDSVTITETQAEALQLGNGYFWVLHPDPTTDQEYGFGIADESGKININTASALQLLNLPGMTQSLAECVYDWRTGPTTPASTGGAKNDYYESLQEPYQAKNGPYETIEELLMVKDITPQVMFGYDANRDGVLDALEQNAGGMSSLVNSGTTDSRGIVNYVTCFSREASASATGSAATTTTPRININSNNLNQLQQALTTTLGQTRATAIVSALQSRINQANDWNLGRFFTASTMTPSEFGRMFPQLTTRNRSRTPAQGLINVNTASAQAFACLPGLVRADGDTLVASRGTANVNDVSWFFNALQPPAKVVQVADSIATTSYFYSADIVAVSGDGRSFKRVKLVVDSRTLPAKIVYRRDLTALGWPLPPELRADMRAGRAPRDAAGGSGFGSLGRSSSGVLR